MRAGRRGLDRDLPPVGTQLDRGAIDFAGFGDLLRAADFQGFIVVEQDMYPAPPDKPLPIARANRDYLRRLGWG